MTRFQPFPGMFLRIGSSYFEFLPHPLLPADKEAVFVLEGGEALVYQVRNLDTQERWALKVFKASYRGPHLMRVTEVLQRHAHLPGLYLGYRICLTQAHYPEAIGAFPELEYAVLMPWIEARTWAGLMLDQAASVNYSFEQARQLALATAQVLWNLEIHSLAHGDIAGSNILLTPQLSGVQLLDLEGLYAPGLPQPKKVSWGSPGYQHRNLPRQGQWGPHGDRFAGAVLLTEMLTWWEPRVRAYVADHAETLFSPQELQQIQTPLWRVVRDVLLSLSRDLLYLFDQAWASSSLIECPELATWAMTLYSIFV
ncbi:hypothetical protein [Thermogemmatispora onikobensis]|uniref:hypothetical protein n=1 Tax=Thermogemmatispora onikobensis TaxID=732234 RepID=UPI000853D7DB|nr:hypothetical protein [Thermogemmatispora onikobensis]